MLSKIKTIGYNFVSEKNLTRLFWGCLILCLVVVLFYGFNNVVKPCYVYPEEQYKTLESEAQRILDEKTLSSDFQYMIKYSTFDDENMFNISVSNKENLTVYGNKYAYVTITVDDYGLETQTTSVERAYSQVEHYIDNTIILVMFIVALSVTLFVGILVIYILIFSICCGIDTLRKRNLKMEE